ncbi:MAG: ThiF family adenylyltransferase [Crenarchaeota archaeon]|nr:ThiF family adenylyltransferase [Thermoproteota archaeon]
MKDVGIDVSDKTVLIGGIGTLGSRIARDLARFNFKKIVLVDFDYVGPENVGYQCYHSEEVGRPKVEALAERLNKYHPWTHLEGVYMEVFTPSGLVSLSSLKEFARLVEKSDAVVTAFDTLPPRATALLLSVKFDKKYIDAGLGVTRGYVKYLKEGYCPICGKVWEEKVRYYTNPNLAEAVAALASQAVLHALSGRSWPSEISLNLEEPYRAFLASDVRNEGCPLCSGEVKKLRIEDVPEYLIKNIY